MLRQKISERNDTQPITDVHLYIVCTRSQACDRQVARDVPDPVSWPESEWAPTLAHHGPRAKMPVNVAGGRSWPEASRMGTGTAGTAAVALRARVLQLRQALVLAMV